MGKIKDHGFLAIPKGRIISIRGGIKQNDHQFCINSSEGPKWIDARTMENWEQIFAVYAGEAGDHMKDPEYKTDCGRREKNGKGRKIWLNTCRLCGIEVLRHIFDHYRCVHAKNLPPCFYCGEPITKNNMWRHVTQDCRINIPTALQSLSIKEVDLTSGVEGKAKEILDQYPKAVLALPFYYQDPNAGDLKHTEDQIAARARQAALRAAAAKKVQPPKLRVKRGGRRPQGRYKISSSTAEAARTAASLQSSSSSAHPTSSAAAARHLRKRRLSGASDTQKSKKKSKYDKNRQPLHVARRTGNPIGKEEAERLKKKREKRVTTRCLNIVTAPPTFASNPDTKTIRINMKKLPIISIRLNRCDGPALIEQTDKPKLKDLGKTKQQQNNRPDSGSSSQNSSTAPSSEVAITTHDKIKGSGTIIISRDKQPSSPPLSTIDDSESGFAEAAIVDSSPCSAAASLQVGVTVPAPSAFLPMSLLEAHKKLAMLCVRKTAVAIEAKDKRASSRIAAAASNRVIAIAQRPSRACAQKEKDFYRKAKMVCGIQVIRPNANVFGLILKTKELNPSKWSRKSSQRQSWKSPNNYYHTFPWDLCQIGPFFVN